MTYLQNKRVLVTGAGGLVGRNLVPRLEKEGAIVTAAFHGIDPGIHWKQYDYGECRVDLLNYDDCETLCEDQDYVFHLAAKTFGIGESHDNPLKHTKANLLMNINMLDAAYKQRVKKLVMISSGTGYPVAAHPLIEEQFFDDEPYSAYISTGNVARITETMCKIYDKTDTVPVILRGSNIYGPHDNFGENGHVLPSLIRKFMGNSIVKIWGDGNDVRDFIYVDDVIDGLLLAVEKINRYHPLNLAAGKSYSINQILPAILYECTHELTTPKVEYVDVSTRGIRERAFSIGKARAVLGFEPKVDIYHGIRKTVEWYKANVWH